MVGDRAGREFDEERILLWRRGLSLSDVALQFAPKGRSCTLVPWHFHPMYSTSSENTRVLWAAHSYNIAFWDEIGHGEYCNAVDSSAFPFPCTSAGAGDASLDSDDILCAPASTSLLIQVSGCVHYRGD